MPSRIIGLTGSFGTGKSTVAGMFRDRGAVVVDADAVTRDLLATRQNLIKKVAKIFPGAILGTGDINRKKLADAVFQHPRELKKLTNILYPEALKQVKKQLSIYKKQRKPFIILDVPLLFEAGWDRLTDTTIVVRAPRDRQIKRLQKRMPISKSDILKRIKHQMPLSAKCLMADIIIDNGGSLRETRRQVDAIIDRLSQRKV